MNRQIATLMTILVFLSGTSAFADEPHEVWLKYLEGNWEWTSPDGNPASGSFRIDEPSGVLVNHGKNASGSWMGVLAWNEGEKVIENPSWGANGSRLTTRFENFSKDEMSGPRSGWTPDGELKAQIRMKRIDANTFEYYQTEATRGGEELEDVTITVKRVLVPKVPAAPKPDQDGDGN